MQQLHTNTNHVVHLHHDRRRRRTVIRLTQKRRNSLSSFLLQRVAPSWRTITLLVVLFLGNNDHQNGTPSISFVRAKGYHHHHGAGGIVSGVSGIAAGGAGASSTVMIDHPLLVPQLHPASQQHVHHKRWSKAASAAVIDVAPMMNLSEVVSRVCPGGGSSTPTRTTTAHHHRHHHQHHHKLATDDGTSTTTTTTTTTTSVTSTASPSKYTFSLYQPGDLSDVNPDGIPDRYMRMQNYNVEKARKALANSLQFRQEHHVDTILGRPHAKFDQCKAVFPHYLLGRTPDQEHVIFLQRPALMQLPLAQQLNLTMDDLLMHYVYVFEYIWNILEGPNHTSTNGSNGSNSSTGGGSNATMVSLIDLTGLDMSLLRRPELLKLVQRFVSMIDAHYPQRAHITMLLNAPKWFGTLYRIISPILRESTKAKIKILSNGQEQEDMLVKYLGQDVVHHVLPQELRKRQQRHHKKRKQHHQNKPQQQQQQPHQQHHRRRGWGGKNRHPPVATTDVEVVDNIPQHKELDVINAAATAAATTTADEEVDPSPVHVAAFNGQASPLEVELRNFCLERVQEAGEVMLPVQ